MAQDNFEPATTRPIRVGEPPAGVREGVGDDDGPIVRISPRGRWFELGLGELWSRRELVAILSLRDVSVRYKQTLLGAGWAILQPLFSTFIFTLIFAVLARVPSPGVPYYLMVLSGLLPWQYFSQAVSKSSHSLVGHAALISKVYFPRLILPLSGVISPLIDLAIGLAILLIVMLPAGFTPTWRLLAVPPLVLVAALAALAVGLWMSVLNVRYRDVGHALPFLLQAGMYASPVVYPADLVPAAWRPIYGLNPMVGVVEGVRWALFGSGRVEPASFALSVGLVLLVLFGGCVVFRKEEETVVDLI